MSLEREWPNASDGWEVIGEVEGEGGHLKLSVSRDKSGDIALEMLTDGDSYGCILLGESSIADLLEFLGKSMNVALTRL